MPLLFDKETASTAETTQDKGRLAEIDTHQLLRIDNQTDQNIASFDQVRALGRWFLNQDFNAVLPSSTPLPSGLLTNSLTGGGAFLGKLALGADAESQFPATVEVIESPHGNDLRIHIVPIHFGALEIAQFGQHTDSLLALAAAAAVAPQFILALEGGIQTTQCATKKEMVTSITPDHGTPLAVTFDAFDLETKTLNSAIGVTGNQNLNIKQAAHLHGQNKPSTEKVSRAASTSKIAAGVPVRSVLRSQLPKHVLFIPVQDDILTGEKKIISMHESLLGFGITDLDLSFIAAALGFTARVVGDSTREQTIEKVLTPAHADTPLRELVTR